MSATEILPELLRFFETKGKEGKKSTIRPAWKIITSKTMSELNDKIRYWKMRGGDVGLIYDPYNTREEVLHVQNRLWKEKCGFIPNKPTAIIYTPPKFKPNESAQIMWNQRNSPKGSWFCKGCGRNVLKSWIAYHEKIFCGECNEKNKIKYIFVPKNGMWKDVIDFSTKTAQHYAFPKILGIVKITEVFKIEMHRPNNAYWVSMDEQPQRMAWDGFGGDIEITKLAKRDGFPDSGQMMEWFDKQYDLSTSKQFWVYRWEYVG
jgi:hypothetical protein